MLTEQTGCGKVGCRLTGHGQFLKEKYLLWFHEVERWALQKAGKIFRWLPKS